MNQYLIDFNREESKKKLWAALKDLQGMYIVKVKQHFDNRTISQNEYYWGFVLKKIIEHIAEKDASITEEDMHELFKEKFNSRMIFDAETGEMKRVSQSTTKMNTKKFGEFIKNVKQWALDFLGIHIEDDSEVYF